MASYFPSSSFAKRVFTLPRSDSHFMSGRNCCSWHCLRKLEVPTTAPTGKSSKDVIFGALPSSAKGSTKASRGSSRSQMTPKVSPSGKAIGTSFVECTAISARPSNKAASNSFTNRPLPPTFANGASNILSPNVDMGNNSTVICGCNCNKASRMVSACHKANGLFRVAMVMVGVELSVMAHPM